MTTHADLVAAVEEARRPAWPPYRDAHCDDLAALLALHKNTVELRDSICEVCNLMWPCPTVGIVRDRLVAWGTLESNSTKGKTS